MRVAECGMDGQRAKSKGRRAKGTFEFRNSELRNGKSNRHSVEGGRQRSEVGTHHIVETKGLEDVNVPNKDRAARLWCENTSALTDKTWSYLKVLQTEFKQLQPTAFSDLIALRQLSPGD